MCCSEGSESLGPQKSGVDSSLCAGRGEQPATKSCIDQVAIGSEGDCKGVPRFAVIRHHGQNRGDSAHNPGCLDVTGALHGAA